MDTKCPWCSEALYNPFTGADVTERDYDLAIEAHIEECPEYEIEQGGYE